LIIFHLSSSISIETLPECFRGALYRAPPFLRAVHAGADFFPIKPARALST